VYFLYTKKFLIGCLMASIAAGIGLAVWRTVLMIRYFDPYRNEYAQEARPMLQTFGLVLFFALVIIGGAVVLWNCFGLKKEGVAYAPFSASDDQAATFTSALLGFLFLAVGCFLFLSLPLMLMPTVHAVYRYTQLIAFALLFLVAAYFVLNATGAPHLARAKKILACVPALWGVTYLIASYANPSYLFKDPNHMLCNLALGILVLFFVYEGKMSATGRNMGEYLLFALLLIVSAMAYIVPNFILLAYWELSSELNFLFEATLIGALIYAIAVAVRLIRSVVPAPKQQKPEKEKNEAPVENGKA